MSDFMLTTIDNQWNYFTNFAEWWKFDHDNGYNTLEVLASNISIEDELSETTKEMIIDTVIQDIIDRNPTGLYVKIYPDGHKSV